MRIQGITYLSLEEVISLVPNIIVATLWSKDYEEDRLCLGGFESQISLTLAGHLTCVPLFTPL